MEGETAKENPGTPEPGGTAEEIDAAAGGGEHAG
jgi:hypothetical protein